MMKEKIVKYIQFFLMMFMVVMGFFFTYVLLWFAIGLQVGNSTFWVLAALAILSEVAFFSWVVGT